MWGDICIIWKVRLDSYFIVKKNFNKFFTMTKYVTIILYNKNIKNAMLTKGLSLLIGPIGMAVTGIWTITDIVSGPAMRVTVPACVIIAYLRKTIMLEKENK